MHSMFVVCTAENEDGHRQFHRLTASLDALGSILRLTISRAWIRTMQHPFDGVILPAETIETERPLEQASPRRGFFKTAAAYALGLLTFGVAGSAFARDGWRYRSGGRYYPQPRRSWSAPPRRVTTYAVGEEGGGWVTTYAVGEEGGGTVTTYAVGEEGGGRVTTYAVGEEGGGRPPGQVTTYALGEEGGGGGVTTQAPGEEGGRT